MKSHRHFIGVLIGEPRGRISPELRAAFERVRAAGRELERLAGATAEMDAHLVNDLAEVTEQIVSIYRRARACSGDGGGGADKGGSCVS